MSYIDYLKSDMFMNRGGEVTKDSSLKMEERVTTTACHCDWLIFFQIMVTKMEKGRER